MELTDGTLLGGRVIYRQPCRGFRTGIEPVLMAASIAARPGERVLEGGTGAGAALLCLLARLPGVTACGVEQDAELADVARANLAANRLEGGQVETADMLALPELPPFDHAMANPPWHAPLGTASDDPRRDVAKRATPDMMASWAAALARYVRPGGSVTLILPSAAISDAVQALGGAECGRCSLMPLWPRAGREARLVLIRALRARQGASRLLAGLVLHEQAQFSSLARAVLWDGAALSWD